MTNLNLTVVIPTYNRLNNLRKRLNDLQSIKLKFQIIIIDNCSPDISRIDYEEMFCEFNLKIDLVINKHNIGAPANLIRAFELCSSEWVWIISDDDPLDVDASRNFLSVINNIDKRVTLVSGCGVLRNDTLISGFDEYINQIGSLTNMIQPAFNIYKRDFVVKDLHRIYHFSSSMCPQIFAVRACLNNSDLCYFFHNSVIKQDNFTISNDQIQWSYLMGYAVFDISISSMSLSHTARTMLKKYIYNALPGPVVFYGSVIKLLSSRLERASIRDLLVFIFNKATIRIKAICFVSYLTTFLPYFVIKRLSLLVDLIAGKHVRVGEPL